MMVFCRPKNTEFKKINKKRNDVMSEITKLVDSFDEFTSRKNDELLEKKFSEEKRMKLADEGIAMPDGSFPIETVKDLKNAIRAYGRASDQSAVAKHIAKRAKALGKEDMIPQTDDFQESLKK